MTTDTVSEWNTFFQSLQSSFTPPEKIYSIVCTNSAETFRTKLLTVSMTTTEPSAYTASMEYHVLRCDADTTLTHALPDVYTSPADVFKAFYNLLWTSSLCSECFSIVSVSETLCSQCYPMRIMYQFGVAHDHTASIPVCSICFDQVYFSKLHCGHYVHKTCFIRVNTERWFSSYETSELKCPLCRAVVDSQDCYDFFLSSFT